MDLIPFASQARPAYLMLPTDIAYMRISATRLKTPLNIEPPPNEQETEEFVLDEIIKLVEAAQNDVIILVDACGIRHGVRHEVEELVHRTGFPVYAAPMGKTLIDESYHRYGGVSTIPVSPTYYNKLTTGLADLCRRDLARRHQGEGRVCEAHPLHRWPEE